jgi:hypothetical protein
MIPIAESWYSDRAQLLAEDDMLLICLFDEAPLPGARLKDLYFVDDKEAARLIVSETLFHVRTFNIGKSETWEETDNRAGRILFDNNWRLPLCDRDEITGQCYDHSGKFVEHHALCPSSLEAYPESYRNLVMNFITDLGENATDQELNETLDALHILLSGNPDMAIRASVLVAARKIVTTFGGVS